jgi:general secretion pathway protein G
MNTNRAFTLVELLIVIVIIALLAGMVSFGVMAASRAARSAAIAMEMNQIAMALENYKREVGEYPPDNGADALKHIKKRFPRNTGTTDYNDKPANSWLVYWFCGPLKGGKFDGFGKDKTNPLNIDGQETDSKKYIETVRNKNVVVVNNAGSPLTEGNGEGGVFVVKNGDDLVPIAYFKRKGDGTYSGSLPFSGFPVENGASPYTTPQALEKPYQLIHPGQDGKFGTGDDITNFSDFKPVDTLK